MSMQSVGSAGVEHVKPLFEVPGSASVCMLMAIVPVVGGLLALLGNPGGAPGDAGNALSGCACCHGHTT